MIRRDVKTKKNIRNRPKLIDLLMSFRDKNIKTKQYIQSLMSHERRSMWQSTKKTKKQKNNRYAVIAER